MARVQIALPANFIFRTEIPLLISHINHGRHLDNAQLLGLVSETRVRFLRSHGYSEMDVEGAGIIVADAALQYRSEAFYGETMAIELGLQDFHDHGCDFVWQMSDVDSRRQVARGKTGIVFFDYSVRRKTTVPAAFRARFASPLSEP